MNDTDRPRKKKKKKKSNKTLVIALIAGGAALVIGIVVLILVLANRGGEESEGPVAMGDPKPGPPEKKVVPGPLVVEGGKTRLGKYVRPLERTETEHVLRTLGMAYHNFYDVHKRGPKDQKELEPFYERNSRITQSLDKDEGWLEFIWEARLNRMPEGPSRTVLAYEKQPEGSDRYVLFGDASFRLMPEDEFAKAPRAQGK